MNVFWWLGYFPHLLHLSLGAKQLVNNMMLLVFLRNVFRGTRVGIFEEKVFYPNVSHVKFNSFFSNIALFLYCLQILVRSNFHYGNLLDVNVVKHLF